jgi:hypothetical protein
MTWEVCCPVVVLTATVTGRRWNTPLYERSICSPAREISMF